MKIKICIIILINFIISYSQYINAPFGGTVSEGEGNVGSTGVGSSYGYLNPAGLYTNYPTISYSTYLGSFIGHLNKGTIIIPGIKNLSIKYPVVLNRFHISIQYGCPDDNQLNIHGSDKKTYKGYIRNDLKFGFSFHPPISKYWSKLDFYLGGEISKYWGNELIPEEIININFGKGINTRIGSILKYRTSSQGQIISSFFIQPGSIPSYGYSSIPGYYGSGISIKHQLDNLKYSWIKLSTEFILPLDWNKSKVCKIGAGFSYRIEYPKERILSLGVFSFPYKPYTNINYEPTIWGTAGLIMDFKYFRTSFSFMTALNLDDIEIEPYLLPKEENSSIFKNSIFSISLDVPLKFKKLKKMVLGNTKQPVFYNPYYGSNDIKIGTMDSINIYLGNQGRDTLKSATIYSNIYPDDGISLNNKVTNIGDICPGEMGKITLSVKSVDHYNRQDYLLKNEYFLSDTTSIRNELEIKTIRPELNVNLKIKQYKKFYVFPTPGEAIIPIEIVNYGDVSAKNVIIEFPIDFIKKGILKNNVKIIKKIKPGKNKMVKFKLNLVDINEEYNIPVKITFHEKFGYAPEPYYVNIKVIDKNKMDAELIKVDHFMKSFIDYDYFFLVLDIPINKWNQLDSLFCKEIKGNNHFPGEMTIGPFKSLDLAYKKYYELITFDNILFANSIKQYLGTPYLWGGNTNSGIDCSAFVAKVYKNFGISIPRTSREQYKIGENVSKNSLQKGDLLFFNTLGNGVSHVGIYIDDNKMAHASSSNGVEYSEIYSNYWQRKYIGAKRIVNHHFSKKNINNDYIENIKFYCVHNEKIDVISRYFIAIHNDNNAINKLKDITNFKVFRYKYDKKDLLVGPFRDFNQIKSTLKFCKLNFSSVKIIECLPNEVHLLQNDGSRKIE